MPIGIYKHISHSGTFKKGHKLTNTGRTRFKKGNIAWNKGVKGIVKGYWTGKKRPDQSLRNKGKKFSEITIKKLSESHKGKTGEKSSNWKGGITPINVKIRRSLEMKLWRKSNMERDNFVCQKCKQVGGKLQVHHINNFADFSELRTSIENGITLCRLCHKEFHKKYGFRNNTQEQLEEFINYKNETTN